MSLDRKTLLQNYGRAKQLMNDPKGTPEQKQAASNAVNSAALLLNLQEGKGNLQAPPEVALSLPPPTKDDASVLP